jgi:glutaredoxin
MFNRVGLVFLFAGTLLGLAGPAAAAIYKWVNENGVVSYQDTPPPAGFRAKVVPQSPPGPPGPDNPARVDHPSAPVPAASIAPVQRSVPQVEIYETSWCGYCKKAKKYFIARGIPFTAYDIEKDRAAAQRKARLSPGGGVPLTVIDGQLIRGFSKSAYDSALEKSR